MTHAPPTAAVARYLDLAVRIGALPRDVADELATTAVAKGTTVGNHGADDNSADDDSAGDDGRRDAAAAMAALRAAWIERGVISATDDERIGQQLDQDTSYGRTLLEWSTESGAKTPDKPPTTPAARSPAPITDRSPPDDADATVDDSMASLANATQDGVPELSRVEAASHLETMTFHERPTLVRIGEWANAEPPSLPSTFVPDLPLDKFAPVRRLGEGGMGEVTLHADRELGRAVAIKTLWPETAADDRASIRFLEEAQITGQLEHPNIIPVYEMGRDDESRPFLVMKCVRGRTLARVIEDVRSGPVGGDLMPIDNDRPLPATLVAPPPTAEVGRSLLKPTETELREADNDKHGNKAKAKESTPPPEGALTATETLARLLEAFLKVCDAVGYAHSRRVVHRDLKPENIMIGRFGEVLVMDWGLAKILHDVATPDAVPEEARVPTAVRYVHGRSHKTMDGMVAGTPMYMSPEQAEGKTDAIDGRTDIYALGCVLYEILSLSAPFEATNTYELLGKVIQARIEPPRARSRAPWRIPSELQAIALKAMARKRVDRYQSIGELKADVHAYQNNQPISAHRDGLLQRAMKWTRRRPAISLASAVASIAALILVTVAAVLINEAERQEQIALARAGKIDELYDKLGVELVRDFEIKAHDFEQELLDALDSGVGEGEFIEHLDPATVASYLDAFNRLIDEGTRNPDRIPVKAWHYFYRGLLFDFAFADVDKAIADYDRAIAIKPDYAPALNNRGNLRADRGDVDGAIDDFTRAIEAEPLGVLPHYNRAIVYLRLRDYPRALEDAEAGVALQPTSGDLWAVLGNALGVLERDEEALAALNRAIALGVRTPNTYYNRGSARARLGEVRAGIDDLTKAIALDSNYTDAYLNRGALRRDIGDNDGAIDDLTRVLLVRPDDERALYNRASAYIATDRGDLALPDLDRLVELDPRNLYALTDRGVLRLTNGDVHGAIADLESALAIDELNLIGNLNLGVIRVEQERYAEAIRLLTRAIDVSPSDANAYYNRGLAHDGLDQLDKAFADYTAAIERDLTHADAFNNRGTLHMVNGDVDLALADYTAAIEIDATNAEYHFNIGMAHREMGELPAAIEDFERGIALAPRDAVLLYMCGKTRREFGDFAGAVQDLEVSLAIEPEYWPAWVQLALSFVQLGDRPRARVAFDEALKRCPDEQRETIQGLRDRYAGD